MELLLCLVESGTIFTVVSERCIGQRDVVLDSLVQCLGKKLLSVFDRGDGKVFDLRYEACDQLAVVVCALHAAHHWPASMRAFAVDRHPVPTPKL